MNKRFFIYIISFLTLLITVNFYSGLYGNMLSRDIAQREKAKKKKVKVRAEDGGSLGSMSYEKLKKGKSDLVAKKDFYTAAKYLEEMVRICDDHTEKQEVMIELGDIWFSDKDYKHAQRVYEDLVMYYPGSGYVGKALSQAAFCSYNQILSYDRDQTITEKTLELIDQFLQRKEAFPEYVPQVIDIQKKCLTRLFEHEMGVANFYFRRNFYKAAQHRLENVSKKYGATIEYKPEIFQLNIKIANATNNVDLSKKIITDLDAQKSLAQTLEMKWQDYQNEMFLLTQRIDNKTKIIETSNNVTSKDSA